MVKKTKVAEPELEPIPDPAPKLEYLKNLLIKVESDPKSQGLSHITEVIPIKLILSSSNFPHLKLHT
jgi:hypothetical protein